MRSAPPPEALDAALRQAAERAVTDGVEAAVARAVAGVRAEVEGARQVRGYRLGEVARVLAVAAALALALDTRGLLTWAQRLEVSPVQSLALALLRPLHGAAERVGLAAPRAGLEAVRARLARATGDVEDPLLAGGWTPAAPPAPAPPAAPSAQAPAPEAPPLPVPAPPAEDLEFGFGDGRAPVLLLGDSMMAGALSAEVTRALERDARVRVVQATQTATGLSRPDVFDWMKVVPPLLARERPRFVVVSLGANDAAAMREGEAQLDFGSPTWRRAYVRRVAAMMSALAGPERRVLWLGLPPMRDRVFSARAATLNRLFAQAARQVPSVDFLEVDMLVSSREGRFETFLRGADGRLVRYRLEDGVHLTPSGARPIARWIVDWLDEQLR